MFKRIFIIICLFSTIGFAQFGKNKVQYKEFTWYYIQSTHFDIYFSQEGPVLTEFAAQAAEDALHQYKRVLITK